MMFYLRTIVFAAVFRHSEADAFLHMKPESSSVVVDRQVVEQTLLEQSAISKRGGLRSIEDDLRSMYAALPKGQHGKLEQQTVRYALHRYFVGKHGWYIKGLLDELGANGSSSGASPRNQTSTYTQNLFPQSSQSHGMDLHELSVFASALSDWAHREASGRVLNIFNAMRLPTTGDLDQKAWESAIEIYVIEYLLGDQVIDALFKRGITGGRALDAKMPELYAPWKDTYMYIQDLHKAHDLAQDFRINPFKSHQYTFDNAVEFVEDFAHNFNSFQNLECHVLKNRLLEMEHAGTGRVRLSRFYSGGLKGDFTFTEDEAFLRRMGALDESDPSRLSVIIPNYISSTSNCLLGSGFYTVCCTSECEGLMRHVESAIAGPLGDPTHIIQVVSGLSSDTVDAPRNLSATLTDRLEAVAGVHGGRVPLHSRLFSQWMHHAFPRECPFPRLGKVQEFVTPEEYLTEYGSVVATKQHMQFHVDAHVDEEPLALEVESLPWFDVEELVATDLSSGDPKFFGQAASSLLRFTMAFAALTSFAVPLMRGAAMSSSNAYASKVERSLV